MCLIIYKARCYFVSPKVDAKNVTGSVVAWNNQTSTVNSDVSDQEFCQTFTICLNQKSPDSTHKN